MTTDTAAVDAMYKAFRDAEQWCSPALARLICDNLTAQGFHLLSWNHDMAQAPRDGTVIDVMTKYGRVPDCVVCAQWGRVYAYDAESGRHTRLVSKPTAWCHLMPPPRETP